MGYLGSGAGIFTLGSIVGLATNQLDRWVALAGVPSLVMAGLALIFAALARRPFDAAYPPAVRTAVERSELYGIGREKEAEASLISVWNLSTALLQNATDKKAGWVMSATWMFVIAVTCLLLPLGVAIAQKAFPENETPIPASIAD